MAGGKPPLPTGRGARGEAPVWAYCAEVSFDAAAAGAAVVLAVLALTWCFLAWCFLATWCLAVGALAAAAIAGTATSDRTASGARMRSFMGRDSRCDGGMPPAHSV